jgi:aryl-alcohol dehydrogenase-like predicted oxidoreductase
MAAVQAMAKRRNVSVNEIVLSYLMSQPFQTIPIFGGTDPEKIKESVKAASVKLEPDELKQLRAA